MKNTLRQVFHSGKFVVGFSIFMFIVLMVIIYPLFVKDPPLEHHQGPGSLSSHPGST